MGELNPELVEGRGWGSWLLCWLRGWEGTGITYNSARWMVLMKPGLGCWGQGRAKRSILMGTDMDTWAKLVLKRRGTWTKT